MKPLASRDALLLQNVGDQLVVYDQARKRLHVLSRSAALVWQHCDGHTDEVQLTEIVARANARVDMRCIMISSLQA